MLVRNCIRSCRGYTDNANCLALNGTEANCAGNNRNVPLRPKVAEMNRTNPFALALLAVAMCQVAVAQPPTSPLGPSSASPDGILRPWKEADAATAETGLVLKLLVKVGETVKAGQPIAELDSQGLHIQLETARAQAAAEGRLMTAASEVVFFKRKLEMLSKMRQKNQANELEEERARVDLRMAEGRHQAELDEKRVLELQVRKLEEQLEERTVKAPIDGVVVKLHKSVGEFVAANTPQVARIADVSHMKAMFFLSDDEVRHLPKDKQIQVRLSNGQVVPARFDYVLPYANDESGLIEMQVIVDNPREEVLGSRCQLVWPTRSST